MIDIIILIITLWFAFSFIRMENNEVYEGSSLSLHTIPPTDLMSDIGNRQHGDLHARFPGEVLDLSSKGLSEDNEKALRELLDKDRPKALILDFNSFSELPDSIPRESLRVVSIAGQFNPKKGSLERRPIFQSIPESISRASNLTDLLVPYNGLAQLPDMFIHLQNLTRINFMCNHFREFPCELLSLSGLREIHLSGNYITEIPAEIAKLRSLEILRVAKNRLKKLPLEIGELSMLSQLSVRNNAITQLPGEITRCTKLIDGELLVEGNPCPTHLLVSREQTRFLNTSIVIPLLAVPELLSRWSSMLAVTT
jgi:Leucine-rich repeat (LRR) protein